MTRPFVVTELTSNTVAEVHRLLGSVDLEPTYQRQAELWSDEKRQLFIDSLINGYDIPKLYFHDLGLDRRRQGTRYAIIDGKQRLEAIEAFMAGRFRLSSDFEDIELEGLDSAAAAAGSTYSELARSHPGLAARLDGARLPIIVVQTRGSTPQDLEIIEEMFSRLNEAVPLNAPEKRNALGGPLPPRIRRLARDRFFESRVGFSNYRYRHLDLATKFLYIEYRDGLADLKKRDLDSFVRQFKARKLESESERLFRAASAVLRQMSRVFVPADSLLGSVGMITVYYGFFREASSGGWTEKIGRESLVRFDEQRAENRARAKEVESLTLAGRTPSHVPPVDPVLSLFERYAQSPNDVTALTKRLAVLRDFVLNGAVLSMRELDRV